MRIFSTLRKKQTELYNGTARIKLSEHGITLEENRHKDNREKFYAVEISDKDLILMVKVRLKSKVPKIVRKLFSWIRGKLS